jgi:hypothetical protein
VDIVRAAGWAGRLRRTASWAGRLRRAAGWAGRLRRTAGFVGILVAAAPLRAEARPRPLFEPTDLEMEKPGWLDVDLQFGPVRADAWRLVVPDVEVDFGILPQVELDIDGAYAIESADGTGISLDHPAPDNLWVAAKLGLKGWQNDANHEDAWALGLQLGPKFPVAPDAHGMGYEALLLAGHSWGDSHLVVNLGGLVDPGGAIGGQRPAGLEGGLDADLQTRLSWLSVTGEVGFVHYVSSDPDELHVTAGPKWSPTESLDISLVALVGFLSGGDRLGVLLGLSPKFPLWK